MLDQRRVPLQGGAEEALSGEEQNDELRAVVELLVVGLAGQFRHVVANLACVGVEMSGNLIRVVGFEGLEVTFERRLGIDHDGAPVRQLDHEVGPQQSIFGGYAVLLEEVAVGDHAGELDDAPELKLSPAAANLRGAQRGHEVGGLDLQGLLRRE